MKNDPLHISTFRIAKVTMRMVPPLQAQCALKNRRLKS
jgi:hypothetical protein